MAKGSKAIITCAVTGGGYTPTMSPHLPVAPGDIAAASIAAAEAGAAMLHLHARDPQTGRPSADPDLFFQFIPQIKARTDAVVIINTGGVQGMPIEDRLAPALRAELGVVRRMPTNASILAEQSDRQPRLRDEQMAASTFAAKSKRTLRNRNAT